MISRKVPIIVASVILISSLLAAQQEPTTPVTIRVTDPSGLGIQAQVRLIPAPDVARRMETDETGQITLDLKPGGYAVFACASAFKAGTAHIDVTDANAAHSGGQAARVAQTFSLALQIQTSSGPEVAPPPAVEGDLIVSAYPFHTPLGFSAANLRAAPHISVTIHNSHTNADETYSGVRLADLLAKIGAPLGSELRGKALAAYIVASGSDGYKAVIALGEVDPGYHPGEVLVADTMDGKALDAHSGPFKLVVTEDKRPARSVRNLVSIELKSAQ